MSEFKEEFSQQHLTNTLWGYIIKIPYGGMRQEEELYGRKPEAVLQLLQREEDPAGRGRKEEAAQSTEAN